MDYLYTQTDTKIITASTMMENHASARVLEKNGFLKVLPGVPEDWGYPLPTRADKWIRIKQTEYMKETVHLREHQRTYQRTQQREQLKGGS